VEIHSLLVTTYKEIIYGDSTSYSLLSWGFGTAMCAVT
jgi:hypothetical protein